MKNRLTVQVIAATVIAVFAGGILLSGGVVEASWLRFYSIAVLVALIVLLAWDRFLWHLRGTQWLSRWITAIPRDLRGTWRGTLESFWEDPATGKRPPKKRVFLVVRQRATSISIVLLTDESRSASTLARFSEADGGATFDYMYLNRPDSRHEHRSRMHHGSASFDVIGRPVTRLKGQYWTSRDTRGEMEFCDRAAHRAEGFLEAAELFEDS